MENKSLLRSDIYQSLSKHIDKSPNSTIYNKVKPDVMKVNNVIQKICTNLLGCRIQIYGLWKTTLINWSTNGHLGVKFK